MKFLADENFPYSSVKILQESGLDVKAIANEAFGITDLKVIEMALNENRTILTFDRDFGELVFKLELKPKAGIVYFRWEDFQPEDPGRFLLELVSKESIELAGYFTVIGKENIRQRIIR